MYFLGMINIMKIVGCGIVFLNNSIRETKLFVLEFMLFDLCECCMNVAWFNSESAIDAPYGITYYMQEIT